MLRNRGWLVLAAELLGWGWAIAFLPDRVNAQPVADTTLGAEQSQVISISPVDFDIDSGARREVAIFHSFIFGSSACVERTGGDGEQ